MLDDMDTMTLWTYSLVAGGLESVGARFGKVGRNLGAVGNAIVDFGLRNVD